MTYNDQLKDDRPPFTQIDDRVLNIGLSPQAGWLYVIITSFTRKGQPTAFPSVPTLASMMCVSENTVRKYRDELVERGLISVQGRVTEDGRQTSNLYTVVNSAFVLSNINAPSNIEPSPLQELNPPPSKSADEEEPTNNNKKEVEYAAISTDSIAQGDETHVAIERYTELKHKSDAMVSPTEYQALTAQIETYGDDIVLEAINTMYTRKGNVKTAYIATMLPDIKAAHDERQNKRNLADRRTPIIVLDHADEPQDLREARLQLQNVTNRMKQFGFGEDSGFAMRRREILAKYPQLADMDKAS